MNISFRGTGVALVTPFRNDHSIDYDALGKLIDHVVNNGVDYLVALGTTGETPTLSSDEKKQVLKFVVQHNAGRVPVVCGMGGNNTAEILEQLKDYDLTGVSALLSVSPYYNKPTQEGIYQHYKAIAQATPLPIILYNVPGRTAGNILPATALRLAKDCSNIVAIKEASGNIVQFMEYVSVMPDGFQLLSGDDNLVLPQIAIGFHGVISVAANSYPKLFTEMVNAALDGDLGNARTKHYQLLKGMDLLFAEGNPAGVKCALKQLGVCGDTLRLPLVNVSDATEQAIKAFVGTIA
ncbi:4-hydroxy-tetrahydrodipicolinate synthase [Rurimicrobium arvi]|uniref:4-hydroxy-tetrahydrodipicolinate synthase n=1 Tax=Rurimicrobium arvi TaxID=2049916 RepID=A0ABP8MJI3_9BACT